MSIVLFLVLTLSMLFSLYYLFARPLDVYRDYLKGLPDQELSLSGYILFIVVSLSLTIVTLAFFSLWAYLNHIGYTWAAIIGVVSAAIRIAWLIRDSHLSVKFIDAAMHIEFHSQKPLDPNRSPRFFRALNFLAEVTSSIYLIYLLILVFQGR